MKRVVLRIMVILAVGTVAGLGFNQARAKNRISLGRPYFAVAPVVVAPGGDGPPSASNSGGDSTDSNPADIGLKHPFTPVTLDEVVEMYLGPGYEAGEIIFVDARDEEHFQKEHIIGAVNIDNYNADTMYDDAEAFLLSANTIVIYCGGGDCEDSIFLATYMNNRGVPMGKIRLFEGGMKAWLNDNLEVEQGLP